MALPLSMRGRLDIEPADTTADEFEAELAPLLPDAIRLATGMLMSAIDAEDAVQEACLRAWRRRGSRRPESDLRPWFFAIVANRCRDVRRDRWRYVVRLSSPAGSSVPGPDPDERLDVLSALKALKRRVRLAVVLRYYLDLPYAEVAEALGCSVDAAKALVVRGVAKLEGRLEPEVRNRDQ